VAGVVRARGDFVDEHVARAGLEQLDTEDAPTVEDRQDVAGDRLGRVDDGIVRPGGRDALAEDLLAVDRLRDGVRPRLPVSATQPHHRDLALEVEELLGHRGAADRVERVGCVRRVVDRDVPPAVVAALAGLQHHTAELRDEAFEPLAGRDRGELGDRDPGVRERLLLYELVLNGTERVRIGERARRVRRPPRP